MEYLKNLNNIEESQEVDLDTLNVNLNIIEKPTLENMRKEINYININQTLVYNIINKEKI